MQSGTYLHGPTMTPMLIPILMLLKYRSGTFISRGGGRMRCGVTSTRSFCHFLCRTTSLSLVLTMIQMCGASLSLVSTLSQIPTLRYASGTCISPGGGKIGCGIASTLSCCPFVRRYTWGRLPVHLRMGKISRISLVLFFLRHVKSPIRVSALRLIPTST